jgi:hypothetical protein
VSSAERIGEDVLAALLWDVPRLRSGGPGAAAFLEAFGPPPWEEPDPAGGVLALAANGVRLKQEGDFEQAVANFRDVAELPEGALLGCCLTGWAAVPELASLALRRAVDQIAAAHPDPEVQARLLAKVAALAVDAHDGELFASCLEAVLERAPANSSVAWSAAIEAMNEGLGFRDIKQPASSGHYDALSALPWVWGAAADAAREIAKERLNAKVRGTWSFTLHAGQTPLDKMVAAEVQAAWAGARGVRRAIRLQIGSHMLTEAARTRDEWVYGLYTWITGDGDQIPQTIRLCEPHLDQRAAAELLSGLDSDLTVITHDYKLAEAADALWALIPDELLEWTYLHVSPDTENLILQQIAHRLWGKLAWRGPELFYEHWSRLQEVAASRQLAHLQSEPLAELPEDSRRALLAAARRQLQESPSADLLLMTAALAEGLSSLREEVLGEIRALDLPAGVLVDVAERRADLTNPGAIEGAVEGLLSLVVEEREQAHVGRVQFGASSARITLGRAAALTPGPFIDAVQMLLEVAGDSDGPSQHMFEAREALAVLARAGRLDERAREMVGRMGDRPGTLLSHGEYSEHVLAAQRRRILAPKLELDERTRLAADTRDPDARVRHVAIATAAVCLEEGPDDTIGWALVTGLFDPDDEVVSIALYAVARGALDGMRDAQAVAADRAVRLYTGSQSVIRESVVSVARHLSSDYEHLARLLHDAASDQSWRVRRAASLALETVRKRD